MANAWFFRPLPIVGAAASSTAVGAPLNVANDYAGIVWRSVVGDVVTMVLDLGREQPADTLALFGIDGDYLDGAHIVIQIATQAQGPNFNGGGTDSGTGAGNYWDTIAFPLLSGSGRNAEGQGVSIVTWGGSAPANFRYLRIIVYGLTGAGVLQISRAAIGKRITLARNFGYGAAFGVRDLGSIDFSARGVMLRRIAKKLRTVGLTFSNIYKDEVVAQTKPLLEKVGNTGMVALVTDPTADGDLQNRCYFGPLVGDLSHVRRNAVAYEAKINLVSIF